MICKIARELHKCCAMQAEITGCLLLVMLKELLRDGLLDYDNVQNAGEGDVNFLIAQIDGVKLSRFVSFC